MVSMMLFMLLGYALLLGNFYLVMMLLIIYALLGIASISLISALWEWWFPKLAKTLIAHKRASSYSGIVDDIGFEIVPHKGVYPEGLIEHKLGFSFLPKPFMEKESFIGKIVRRGRPPKNPEQAEAKQKEVEEKAKEELKRQQAERDIAQTLALKQAIFKGVGKPIFFEYAGSATAFNPYVLVPSEASQDNPHTDIDNFIGYIKTSKTLTENAKEELLTSFQKLQSKLEHLRVIIDPRRFKEIQPRMYTRDHISAHRRINFERGRASVTGMPIGKLLIIALVIMGAIGGIFAIYYFFMRPQVPQQATALISYIRSLL